MSVQTAAAQHTSAAQAAVNALNANGGTGYAKDQNVHKDGVVWVSLRDNNLYAPGHGLGAWWGLAG